MLMNATLLYRIAAVLLNVFAAGHTYGFLKFKPSTSDGVAVRDGMDNVHFQIGSSSFTYGGFYRGFGLFATVYLCFAAFLAWHLGALARSDPHAIGSLGWAFCLLQLASMVLSWIYFLPPPIVLSALLTICTGWAAWLVR
jgi:hypothetical protein